MTSDINSQQRNILWKYLADSSLAEKNKLAVTCSHRRRLLLRLL